MRDVVHAPSLRALGRALLAATLIATFVPTAEAQPRTADDALIDSLMGYLGFSADHREAMLSGGVVHSGMDKLERREEEVAAAGVVMLVKRRPAPEAIGRFLDAEVFKQVHDLTRYDPLALADHTLPPDRLFGELALGTGVHVRRLVGQPTAELNLSAAEAEPFIRVDAGRHEARAALGAALRDVLASRLADYVRRGLDGVEDYARPNGRHASPAAEVRSAIDGLAVFEPEFGPFLRKLGTPVQREDEENGSRQLLWVEKSVSGTPVWGLLDQQRSQGADAGIAAEIHYYASSMYNSMLTLVAALPYEDQTLVFAINLMYTEQVLGFGSALKRKIARHMAATALAKHLERVRDRVEALR
jgi:hypothetical protein